MSNLEQPLAFNALVKTNIERIGSRQSPIYLLEKGDNAHH
jgi:hypothetical protein